MPGEEQLDGYEVELTLFTYSVAFVPGGGNNHVRFLTVLRAAWRFSMPLITAAMSLGSWR